MSRAGGPRRGIARLGATCATLLVLLLPTLLAVRHAADPVRPDERERLARAFAAPPAAAETALARGFLRVAAGVDALPAAPDGLQAVVVRARTRQLGCLLLTTLCLYAAVAAARGRLQALLACLLFAALPAVAAEGAWLRPEAPAAAAAAAAVLLFLHVAHQPRTASGRRRRAQVALQAGLAVCGVAAQATAVALLPTQGAVLLLPGTVLAILAAQLALRSRPLLRRGGWLRLPVRAMNRRLLPWTALSFLSPGVALWALARALRGPAEAVAPTASAAGLLPAGIGGALLSGLFALGALAMVVHVGATFRRHGRASAALALFAGCAVAFAAYVRAPAGCDLLVLAVPTATVLAAGAHAVLVLGQRALAARRRPPLSAA